MKDFEIVLVYLISENKLPDGWTKDSVSKFGETIGKKPDEHGFFDLWVSSMSSHLDDDEKAKGLCANMKDVYLGTTFWRGKDKIKN